MPAPVPFDVQPTTGKRVAVIGSGPTGMSTAYYLLIAGHDVTVYERDPPPGGMLRYGIPQYRLPKVEVLEAEYDSVSQLGGKIVCNVELGKDYTLDDLQNQGFDAVCVAIGCYDTNKLGVPGRGRRRRARRSRIPAHRHPRTALPGPRGQAGRGNRRWLHLDGLHADVVRQGASEVTLVYRRDMKEMSAANEVHEAIEEGARHLPGGAPTRVVTDKNDKVTGVEFQRMAMGAPDASGRRRPEPVAGTEFVIDCDRVLLAIGQGPTPRPGSTTALRGSRPPRTVASTRTP